MKFDVDENICEDVEDEALYRHDSNDSNDENDENRQDEEMSNRIEIVEEAVSKRLRSRNVSR